VHISPRVLALVAPGVLRSLQFYGHLMPVIAGYARCMLWDSKRLGSEVSDDAIQELWDRRHEWGAERIRKMILELGGFYLKVGQVFATKSDLLPPQYVSALKSVFDDCPPVDSKRVLKIVEAELGAPVSELFHDFDHEALATATIAQVHVAHLNDPSHTKVAVKVQNPESEALMAMDMRNMLRVSESMDNLGLHLPFDNTSILREYQTQVPLEFDFHREADMLKLIGGAVSSKVPEVTCPKSVDDRCTKKVLTMTFVEGEALGDIIQRAITAAGMSSAAGASEKSAAAMRTKGGELIDGHGLVSKLIETFGVQIFTLGKFHSDPHPGNLLVAPDGKTLSIIDFGQTKVLQDRTRLGLARLILALAANRRDEALAEVSNFGLKLTNAAPDFALTVCYILFDTRMDLEEAHVSPLDADLPEDMRVVNIKTIPEELFMMIRVVALMRGILVSLDTDVHARMIWRPYAIAALREAGELVPQWALDQEEALQRAPIGVAEGGVTEPGAGAGTGGGVAERAEQSVYAKMKRLAKWMQENNLPHDRKALMPFAGVGMMSVHEIATTVEADEQTKLDKAFRKFSEAQRTRCFELAIKTEAAEAAVAKAAAAEASVAADAKALREAKLADENTAGKEKVSAGAVMGTGGSASEPPRKTTTSMWKKFKRYTGVTASFKPTPSPPSSSST